MPTLLRKVQRVLDVRGETFQSLYERMSKRMYLKSRQTLYDWLNEKHQPRNPHAFAILAEILDIAYEDLMDENIRTPQIKHAPVQQTHRGINLAAVLLDILVNPDASPDDKDVAKYTILRMLEERPRTPA
jgi:hypothetical protein